MESVLQNGRRKHRPWTAQEQVTAEVAAACGLTFSEIGRVLDRSYGSVQYRLDLAIAERTRGRAKGWHQNNREESRQISRRYYLANRSEQREKQNQYRIANHEKIIEAKRNYSISNSKQIVQRVREWRAKNPDKRREHTRSRSALERASRQRSMNPLTLESKTIRFALWRNRCAYCGAVGKMTVDHVLPLFRGGLDDPANAVPACGRCNSSKSDAPIEWWYRRQPFFTESRWRKIQRHCPAAVVGQLPLALPA
jgi:5-methylcytosine-specific restriction endonuclease McrA